MRITKKYQGVIIPAVTPLTEDCLLDREGVTKLLAFFRQEGVMPFILGTTGEAPSLPASLKNEYVRMAARQKPPGEVLYAGISSNCQEESVDMGRRYLEAGVDVVVATLPSYYGLREAQMTGYFEQLADRIGGPLMIYNIPSTTHMSIPLSVIDELSRHPHIVGTKDSERSEDRLAASLGLWAGREDFSHFLGWAAKSAEAVLGGSDGLVPSTGNINPGIYRELYAAASAHHPAALLQQQSDALGELYQAGRLLGDSLAALKVILHEAGLCQPYVMPPLERLTGEAENALRAQVQELRAQVKELRAQATEKYKSDLWNTDRS
jgi:dihydrodipicolinate synthase/N-acetylneuraminate lyase